MTRAVDDSTRIPLAEAVRLVAAAFGYSPALAERDLGAWLAGEKIRWWGVPRGQRLESDPGEGDPAFWQGGPSVRLSGRLSENRATRTIGAGRLEVRAGERAARPARRSYGFVAIEVARGDVIAALPASARARLVEAADAVALAQTPSESLTVEGSGNRAAPAAPDPFRSGAPGRPSAVHLVEVEGRRRIETGEVVPTQGGLSKLAIELSRWWESERLKSNPPGQKTGQKAIAARLRSFWNSRLTVA